MIGDAAPELDQNSANTGVNSSPSARPGLGVSEPCDDSGDGQVEIVVIGY